MRLLALLGSAALLVWLVGIAVMTFHNLSKFMFGHTFEQNSRVRFFMRQIMIVFWPLVLASAEGRRALDIIWKGKWDEEA